MESELKSKLVKKIKELVESSKELTLRTDYSGRGMFGRTCIGIEYSERSDFINFLSKVISKADLLILEDEYLFEEYCHAMLSYRSDSMGIGSIAYWPELETK